MSEQYTDRQLTCADCGTDFAFTAGEQEHYAKLGFTNDPKRCAPCRAAKKRTSGDRGGDRRGGGGGAPKEFYTASCADCGGQARVPFKPSGNKPVYCSDCFGKRR